MSIEKQKLASMLKQNKITDNDYRLLLNAMENKSDQNIISLFINPFQKIAGLNALIMGIIVIIALSYIGVLADVYFMGIFDCLNAANLKHMHVVKPNFQLLLSQNLIDWIVLSITFMLAALVLKQKRIRIIDFFGTVALARFPYIFLSLFIAIVWLVDPTLMDFDLTKTEQPHGFSFAGTLINFMWQFCWAWQITTYFFALKESSGLNGTRLWIGFVVSVLIADQIAHSLGQSLIWLH